MDLATQILVIINSAVLVVFLVLAIVLIVKVLKLVKQLKLLVEKAEDAAGALESVSEAIRQSMAPVGFSRFVGNFAGNYFRKKRKGKK